MSKIIQIATLKIDNEHVEFDYGNIVVTENNGFKRWEVELIGVNKVVSMNGNRQLEMLSMNGKPFSGEAFVSNSNIMQSDITLTGTGVLIGY